VADDNTVRCVSFDHKETDKLSADGSADSDCSHSDLLVFATLSVAHGAVGLNIGRHCVCLLWSNETQRTVCQKT
jgi:hypothetical protein